MAIRHKQGRRTVLLAALFVACAPASSAAGQSTKPTATNQTMRISGSCVTPKPFSPQDAGLHAVILGEWGATVGKPLRAACNGTRAR
jgi:hypothetical protein